MSSGSCHAWVIHHRTVDFERIGRHWLFVLVFAWLTILAANLLGAALKNVAFTVSDPLNAGYGWTTRANVVVGGGQAVLTEDGVILPGISQQFLLSSNVTRIHITLKALNLVTNEGNQLPDSFHVALLGTNGTSLLPDTGQSNSTACFSYYQDGTVHYGSSVAVPGASGSGDVWQPQFPVTIVLDVTTLTNDVTATLSFDLAGFGQFASSVTVARIRMEGIEPLAAADTVSTAEDNATVISILTNDTAMAGVPLDPASIQIVSLPANGTATVNTVTGTIGYQPATNYAGADSFTYTVADIAGNRSAAATVSLTVTAVNDAPSFTKGADQMVNEDAGAQTVAGWATAISRGPANEAGQSVDFLVSNDNNPLFSVQPAIGANGTLTYTPAAHANGAATVTVQIRDDGGVASGGVDTSAGQSFTITVHAVNDAPTLAAITDPAPLLEDAGLQTVNLAGIGAGGGESQVLTVTASSSNPGLIPNPTVNHTSPSATGSLSYAPVAHANGTATITVVVTDDGGTASGGVDAVTNTFTVTVTAVNDAPTLGAIGNVNIAEDAGMQTVNLAGVSAGGGETQALTVTASSSAPLLIPNPTVNYTSPGSTGTLTFTPVAHASGTATIIVVVQDNGGTEHGGVDAVTNSFTVTISAVNDPPTLDPVADQLLAPGQSLSLTLTATDIESPAGNLQFSLLSGPSGLTVSPAGLVQWTAAATETAVTNEVGVRVADDGAPSQSATQTFRVVVIPKPVLQITGSAPSVTVQWPAVVGLRYQLQFTTDITAPAWTDLGSEGTATASTMSYVDSSVSAQPRRFYRVRARL